MTEQVTFYQAKNSFGSDLRKLCSYSSLCSTASQNELLKLYSRLLQNVLPYRWKCFSILTGKCSTLKLSPSDYWFDSKI